MASGNEENEDWNSEDWPTSGQDGPEFEWEYVPIPFKTTNDKEIEEKKSEVKEEENLPSVEDIKLEDTDGEKPLRRPKVRNFSRLNPSQEDMKAIPDDLDNLFAKHGDDLMIEEKSGKRHIYFLFGETGGQKHYKCINSNCHSSLVVEYMDPPKEDSKEETTPKEDSKEETTKRATENP